MLHSFTGGADGSEPYAGLALDTKGNLYGTTSGGGASGGGVQADALVVAVFLTGDTFSTGTRCPPLHFLNLF